MRLQGLACADGTIHHLLPGIGVVKGAEYDAANQLQPEFIQRLAKFANYDTFANPVFDRGEFQDGLRPNADFMNQPTMTVQSKMNEGPSGQPGTDEESPF